MNIHRLVSILALLILCASACSAQESRCVAKVAELPTPSELRGFRIGMTTAEVKARLPKLQSPPADEFGFASLNIFPDHEPRVEKDKAFEGVRAISVDFLDGRVFSFWIGYDKTFKWQTLDEFASGIIEALKLPGTWRTRLRARLLDCADFTLAVIPVGQSPSLKVTDNAAKDLWERRKAAKEDDLP